MIYDCFSFFNELDVLEIRLNTLAGIVDKFVLVEDTLTHSGNDKKLYYDENKERFRKFHKDIIHIIVKEHPKFETPWTYENHQRNCIMLGLKDAKPDDTIIISDLDEIPHPEAISKYHNWPGIKSFQMKMCEFFCNYIRVEKPFWTQSRMLSYHDLLHHFDADDEQNSRYVLKEINKGSTPTKIRSLVKSDFVILNGGWHFTYCGGIDSIIMKIKSFAHQESNIDELVNPKILKQRLLSGVNILGRNHTHAILDLDSSFPDFLIKNKNRFRHLIAQKSNVNAEIDTSSLGINPHGRPMIIPGAMRRTAAVATTLKTINTLATAHRAYRYLEIGLWQGANFFNVNIAYKVGVDTAFPFEESNFADEGRIFFRESSDDFFVRLKENPSILPMVFSDAEGKPVFDFIYINTQRTFKQTLRDFQNSLAFAHDKTIWLLDNTVPSDPYSALPDSSASLAYRKESKIAGKHWHGDSFKTIFAIHDFYPDFSYCTLLRSNPQTVIWRSKSSVRKRIFNSIVDIDQLDYFGMLKHAAILMPLEDEFNMLKLLWKPLEPLLYGNENTWKKLIFSRLRNEDDASILPG